MLDRLAGFDPHVAGTPPLGLDLPGSDIDILCHAPNADAFADALWRACAHETDFRLYRWREADQPTLATFQAHGWAFEIYGSPLPVADQAGWRHFVIERRLLALGGAGLRAAILDRRREGLKTESAFATVIQLEGDSYSAMLTLHGHSDEALKALLERSGFGVS